MNIAVVASGTRGDVQPYVALGRGLKGAGHDVRLLTSDNFETLVTEAGLTFRSTGESVEAMLRSDEWRKTLAGGNFLAILARMRAETARRAAGSARLLRDGLAGSELIVTGMSGMGGAFSLAGALGIPVVQAYVFPFTPTRELPSPLTPALPFGGALNRLSFHVTRQMFWQTTKAGDAATRRELGLGKGPRGWPYGTLARSRVPALYGYSPRVLPQPRDWPENHRVTGHWFLDAPDGWTPPPALVDFLMAGEPPVYIGFDSMSGGDPQGAGRAALEALTRSGRRGVLAPGWGGLAPDDLPDTVFPVASIPHDWLFPRMAAVVHHGGAGTTAAALRAGVPQVVVPFMGDQPFWGRRMAALGVGARPIPRRRLTGERLAGAITEATADAAMRQRAAALGREVRAEDGIGEAVAHIERFARGDAGTHRAATPALSS